MKLKHLLTTVFDQDLPAGWDNHDIDLVVTDSRQVSASTLFVAVKGTALNGEAFIPDAVTRGAKVIAKQGTPMTAWTHDDVLLLSVPDIQKFLVAILQRLYGQSQKLLVMFGITGTNGKTTVSYLLESILEQAERNCGVIGTVEHRFAGARIKAHNTTPGLVDNYALLAQMVESGIQVCVMEVSSHALSQGRVDGIDFSTAVFTNLTRDHLDYHKTEEAYFLAKSKLFTGLTAYASAVINHDDQYASRLIGMLNAPKVVTYGLKDKADVRAENVHMTLEGTSMDIVQGMDRISLSTRLVGRHNVYNCLAAFAAASVQGIDLEEIQMGIESMVNVPGRLESIDAGQDFSVFVDYAHTDDALLKVLGSLRELCKGKLIVVFGCGGDRDPGKRPRMAKVADTLCDFSIITNDNPRTEDPQQIIDQIRAGFHSVHYKVTPDRKEAIQEGLEMAEPDDVVLIAGKGHEDYQIFQYETIPFDERSIVRQILEGILNF